MKTMSRLVFFLVIAALIDLPVAAEVKTFTIASGASLSDAVDMKSCTPARILINPTAISSSAWTAANLTFRSSEDGVTYGKLTDAYGAEVTVTVDSTAAATEQVVIVLSPGDWWIPRFLQVRSGTAATPVTQTRIGGTLIKFVCR